MAIIEGTNLTTRRSTTLVKWFDKLNCWGWPREFGEAESRDISPMPRRQAIMDAIVMELGRRKLREVR